LIKPDLNEELESDYTVSWNEVRTMSLSWSRVPSIRESAQLEQLPLPGHLLLPDFVNLRGKKMIFSLPCLEGSQEPGPGESPVTRTSHDRVPRFLCRRSCPETVQRVVRKGLVSPQKPCVSSKPTITAQTLPVRSSQKCWTQLPGSREHLELLPDLLRQLVCSSLKHLWKLSARIGRPAIFITRLTPATQSLSISHSLLGKKKSLIKALLH